MASVAYNFIQKIFSLRSKKFCQQNENMLHNVGSTLMEIQKILIWDDPFFSCCCVIIVNIVFCFDLMLFLKFNIVTYIGLIQSNETTDELIDSYVNRFVCLHKIRRTVFWGLIVYLDFKFYGIIFTALLILTCEQLWTEHFFKYFTENNSSSQNIVSESLETSDERTVEINTFFKKGLIMLKEFYVRARFLRQSQPGVFCILTSLGFLLLGVIGRSLSNVIAFYILLMLIMTVPGVLNHFLPPQVIKSVSDILYSSRRVGSYGDDDDDEVEPYLPDTSEETLELLRLAGDSQEINKEDDEDSNDLLLERMSERVSDTTESECSKMSLYPDSVMMPSAENSLDFWDFGSKEKTDLSEIESHGINFQSQHFDGNSSEEEFVKGLDLSEKTLKKYKKDKAKQNQQSNLSITPVNKKLLTDLEQKDSAESLKESSSDTDSFELISEEDM